MTTVGLIQVDLELTSAGGVTAPELNAAVDLPLSRRDDGEVWTPPTSLAGSLRAHLAEHATTWLGSDPPRSGRTPDHEQLEASRVRFLGSRTVLPESGVAVRHSTAIDPRRGAAASATLRATQVAPAGTAVTLYLRIDLGVDGNDDLPELIEALASWRPVIGRGRSTGQGLARVTRVASHRIDLNTRAGLRQWLIGRREVLFPDEGWDAVRIVPAPPAPDAELEMRFLITSALHIGGGKGAHDGEANRSPVMTENGRPILPGTSWKGLLRSRCGYILRSCGRPACLTPAEPSCRECRLCDLFGWTGRHAGPGRPVGRVGRLSIADSVIDGPVGHRNHVGIDRFTGGARRALLFADDVVDSGSLTLRVTMTTRTDQLTAAERGLLLLAIRDLHDGLIGVGRGSTRGYGSLHLSPHDQALLRELDAEHPTGDAVISMLRGENG